MKADDFRIKAKHIPFAREGIPYVSCGVLITLTTAILGKSLLAWLSLVVTLLVGHFFRDPIRWNSAGPQQVISPADGKVIVVEPSSERRFTNQRCMKISIFMSVFDVHVNRIPVSGKVEGIYYQKGKYHPAQRKKASRENEQNWVWIRTETGHDVVVTQVAGLIARRIVCWPAVGDRVRQGERFGMIRFGSRLDVYVPGECQVLVSKGDRVFAGESILCQLK